MKQKYTLENFQYPDHYGQWLGYKIKKIDRKKWQAYTEIRLREDHLSPAGRIHGGVISGFFDFTCGAAVFSTLHHKDYCSTVELKVNYFKPLDSGDRLYSRATVKYRGKRICVVLAELFRKGEKEPVALATATFNVITQ